MLKLLLPSLRQASLYLLIILLGVLLTADLPAWQFLQLGVREVWFGWSRSLAQFSSNAVFNNLVLAIFWSAIGLVCYGVYLQIANVLIWAQNQATIEGTFTNLGNRTRHFGEWVHRLIWIVILLLVIWLSVALIWPAVQAWWAKFWAAPFTGASWLLVGSLVAFADLHLIALLILIPRTKKLPG